MVQVPNISESQEGPHFHHAICLFFQNRSIVTAYKRILYLLFSLKVRNPKQYNKSQLII